MFILLLIWDLELLPEVCMGGLVVQSDKISEKITASKNKLIHMTTLS